MSAPNKPSRFLTAEWRHLAMLNYHIDPAALRSRVPRGTKLDSWNGKTFVSLVGFMFLNTKLLGVPVPFHRHFEEVNLRFYVRSRGEEGWRRGGVFVKEIVPRWAIAAVARLCYGERYVCVPMRHRLETDAGILRENGAVKYEWRHHAEWSHLEVRATGQPAVPQAGSEEEFITELTGATPFSAAAARSSIGWNTHSGECGRRPQRPCNVMPELFMVPSFTNA